MKETNPHLTLLDVGAGSGTISTILAKAIPDGEVNSIDINPGIVARARAIAEMETIKNIEFQQGYAYGLPFADETFDITFCYQLLTHMKAPWDALSETMRVTKLDGIIAAVEGDLKTYCVWSELSGLHKSHKFDTATIEATGGTSTGGRQLLSWTLKAGVAQDQITISYSAFSYSTPAEKKTWAYAQVEQARGGWLREKALKVALVIEDDFKEMPDAWEEWVERDDAISAMMQGEILIQR